jgi:hypothetical protein
LPGDRTWSISRPSVQAGAKVRFLVVSHFIGPVLGRILAILLLPPPSGACCSPLAFLL